MPSGENEHSENDQEMVNETFGGIAEELENEDPAFAQSVKEIEAQIETDVTFNEIVEELEAEDPAFAASVKEIEEGQQGIPHSPQENGSRLGSPDFRVDEPVGEYQLHLLLNRRLAEVELVLDAAYLHLGSEPSKNVHDEWRELKQTAVVARSVSDLRKKFDTFVELRSATDEFVAKHSMGGVLQNLK